LSYPPVRSKEKLEPPVPPAGLKAPRALSFLLPMRRSAREKDLSASGFAGGFDPTRQASLSASDFALRAWGFALGATTRQVAEGGTVDTWERVAWQYVLIAQRVEILSESLVPIRKDSSSLASLAPLRLAILNRYQKPTTGSAGSCFETILVIVIDFYLENEIYITNSH